ncbi:hypothetical protein AB0M44_47305 [Streptosporangium subroseum]|uniref:hypothetical protein n=1 Tax=Streptosporangium subroseum TaxID=106412 RepID=UPI0034259565
MTGVHSPETLPIFDYKITLIRVESLKPEIRVTVEYIRYRVPEDHHDTFEAAYTRAAACLRAAPPYLP